MTHEIQFRESIKQLIKQYITPTSLSNGSWFPATMFVSHLQTSQISNNRVVDNFETSQPFCFRNYVSCSRYIIIAKNCSKNIAFNY